MKLSNTHICRLLSRLVISLLLVAGSVMAAGEASVNTDDGVYDDTTVDSLPYVPGQIVIKFAGNSEESGEFVTMIDTAAIARLQSGPVYLLQFDTNVNVNELSKRLQVKQGVAYTHPNYVLDSLLPVQGSRAFGDEEGNGDFRSQYAADMLEVVTAHTMATGQGVRIGIIDGGVDINHPIFKNTFGQGWDFVDDDGIAFDEPDGLVSGHGTFVAGAIHLVAPDAELVPYRVMDTTGAGNGFTLARAIEQAVYDGCKIINISALLVGQHYAVRDAIRLADDQNVIVVAAAGNNNSSIPAFPAAEQEVLAVTAIDSQFVLADFSNYGNHIGVCAPGVDIYSAYRNGENAWWSGTSFASPLIAGQVALMVETQPDLSSKDVEKVYSLTNLRLASEVFTANSELTFALGYGLVSSVDALTYLVVENLRESTSSGGTDTAVVLPENYYFKDNRICGRWLPQLHFLSFSTSVSDEYTAEILPGGDGFAVVRDPVEFEDLEEGIIPVLILTDLYNQPGIYTDTLQVTFEGMAQPVKAVIHFDQTTPCIESNDSAFVVPLTECHFIMEQNRGSHEPETDTAYFEVTSTNEPTDYRLYSIHLLWEENTRFLRDFYTGAGYTPDTFAVTVSSRGLAPGFYYDTFYVEVQGVVDAEIPVELTMEVLADEGNSGLTNHPNPFNPSTTINFRLSQPADVELTIYNILGQEVACLLNKRLEIGEHSVLWPGTNSKGEEVGSGIYFCRLKQGSKVESKKMLMMK